MKETCCANIYALIFELVGTFILAFTYSTVGPNPMAMGIALWFIGLIGGKISGAHVNPAVTIAYMLRPSPNRMHFCLGLFFILFQALGALAAGFVRWMVDDDTFIAPVPAGGFTFGLILLEIMGAFAVTAIVLMNSETQTKLVNDEWVVYLLQGAALALATYWAAGLSKAVFNPALGFGLDFARTITGGSASVYLKWFWGYVVFPPCGSILALLFHQCYYKKATEEVGDKNELLMG